MNSYKSRLDERTLEFAKRLLRLCKALPRSVTQDELVKQCVRSGTSIGANYREANDALGKKDFVYRLRISRKEAKETAYWLDLILESNPDLKDEIALLLKEVEELGRILSSIISKIQ